MAKETTANSVERAKALVSAMRVVKHDHLSTLTDDEIRQARLKARGLMAENLDEKTLFSAAPEAQ